MSLQTALQRMVKFNRTGVPGRVKRYQEMPQALAGLATLTTRQNS